MVSLVTGHLKENNSDLVGFVKAYILSSGNLAIHSINSRFNLH